MTFPSGGRKPEKETTGLGEAGRNGSVAVSPESDGTEGNEPGCEKPLEFGARLRGKKFHLGGNEFPGVAESGLPGDPHDSFRPDAGLDRVRMNGEMVEERLQRRPSVGRKDFPGGIERVSDADRLADIAGFPQVTRVEIAGPVRRMIPGRPLAPFPDRLQNRFEPGRRVERRPRATQGRCGQAPGLVVAFAFDGLEEAEVES
jgi:hypothetical protein